MTREHKLALIVGFSLVLVLGVLISDHFSKARQVEMAQDIQPASARQMGATTPGARMATEPGVIGAPGAGTNLNTGNVATRTDLDPLPGVHGSGGPSGPSLTMGTPSRGPNFPLLTNTQYVLPPNGDQHNDPPGVVPPSLPVPVVQIPMQKYDIQEGDTLYRIANRIYGDGKLWEKVRDCNKDKVSEGNSLKVGVTLLLPPKDVLLGKPYVPPVMTQTPAPGPRGPIVDPLLNKPGTDKAAGEFKDYVVKPGDTLASIARTMLKSGKRASEIIEANKSTLSDPDALSVGMKLRLPAH